MKFTTYNQLFEQILSSKELKAPYDNPDFLTYTELNQSRQQRWMKKGEINEELENLLKAIPKPMKWILITEPWCGDASHLVPFIAKLADKNNLIDLEIQLRDSDSEIDRYLTNGGKSIPMLIVRNEKSEDLFVWGPRPKEAQSIHLRNLDTDKSKEEKKIELQKWYNADKGQSLQIEILTELRKVLN